MKAVPIAAKTIGFLSFMKNIFKIVITRATKSDLNPIMLVARTALNQSVKRVKIHPHIRWRNVNVRNFCESVMF